MAETKFGEWVSFYFFLSKQELYFVKENYEIFSTEVSAKEQQGQNSGEPHQGLIWSLEISSVFGHFEFIRRMGST